MLHLEKIAVVGTSCKIDASSEAFSSNSVRFFGMLSHSFDRASVKRKTKPKTI